MRHEFSKVVCGICLDYHRCTIRDLDQTSLYISHIIHPILLCLFFLLGAPWGSPMHVQALFTVGNPIALALGQNIPKIQTEKVPYVMLNYPEIDKRKTAKVECTDHSYAPRALRIYVRGT